MIDKLTMKKKRTQKINMDLDELEVTNSTNLSININESDLHQKQEIDISIETELPSTKGDIEIGVNSKKEIDTITQSEIKPSDDVIICKNCKKKHLKSSIEFLKKKQNIKSVKCPACQTVDIN